MGWPSPIWGLLQKINFEGSCLERSLDGRVGTGGKGGGKRASRNTSLLIYERSCSDLFWYL